MTISHTQDNNRFSFTIKSLDSLNQQGIYYDTYKGSALQLSIRTDGGSKSFQVRKKLKGKVVKVVLGKYPELTINDARIMARDAINQIAKGINPNLAKKAERKKHINLDTAFDDYLNFKKLKPKTIQGYKTSYRNVLSSLGKKQMNEITYNDILKVHKNYSTKGKSGKPSQAEADRAMRLLRAIFFYVMDELIDENGNPLIMVNPVKKLFKAKQVQTLDRKVTKLEDDQIGPFLNHIENMTNDPRPFFSTGADLILLLLFHGTRFTETASIKWHNVDMKYQRFWLTETKGGRRLWLPMNTYTYNVFKRRKAISTGSEYVFSSIKDESKYLSDVKKPLKDLLEQTGIAITPHDLRRTFLGLGNRLAMSPYTLKQLSNHALAKNDVTAGYVIQSADELREPSQKIANRILELSGKTAEQDSDEALFEMLKSLSDEEKKRLFIRINNIKDVKR